VAVQAFSDYRPSGGLSIPTETRFGFPSRAQPLKIDLFDDSGKLVGNAQDGIQDFGHDPAWHFEAGIVGNDGAVAASVCEIRGWP
jgi:hypothetical protein